MESGESFVARFSRVGSVPYLIGFIVFIALGLWIAGYIGDFHFDSGGVPSLIDTVIGWAGMIFGGVGVFFALKRIALGGLAFRIDRSGILVPRMSDEVIHWQDIADVSEVQVSFKKIIGVEVADRRAEEMKALARFFMPLTHKSCGYGVTLTTAGTNVRHKEAMAAIERFSSASHFN